MLATYVSRGLAGGRVPYRDVPFEYPPGIGYLAGALSLVSPNAAVYAAGWSALIVVAAAAGGYALSRAAGPRRALLRWSLAPQLLLLAGLNFDVLPAALLAGAAIFARERRQLASVVMLGLGTVVKLFPAVAAPLVVLRASRGGAGLALAFAALVVVPYAPSLAAPFSSGLGLAYQGYAQEANLASVWGLAAGVLVALGAPDPAALTFVITAVGLAATYVLAVVPKAIRARDPAIGFGLATVALLFWNRVYSPQYSLWLLPIFVLLPLSGRAFALLSVADVAVFATVSPLSLVRWQPGDALAAAVLGTLAAAVVLRHVALVLAWRELLRMSAVR